MILIIFRWYAYNLEWLKKINSKIIDTSKNIQLGGQEENNM